MLCLSNGGSGKKGCSAQHDSVVVRKVALRDWENRGRERVASEEEDKMDGMCGVDSVWQVVCANCCAVESESERVPIPRVARALQKQLESRGSVTLTSTASHVRFRAFYRSGTTERGGLTSLSNLKIVGLTSSRSIAPNVQVAPKRLCRKFTSESPSSLHKFVCSLLLKKF